MFKDVLVGWGAAVGLLALLILSSIPVPFLWLTACALPFFLWLCGEGIRRGQILFFVGVLGLLLVPLLSSVNASHAWQPGVGALPVSHVTWLPSSAYPEGSWRSLAFIFIGVTVVGLSKQLKAKQLTVVLHVAVAAGAMTALVVVGQRVSPQPYPVFEKTGFFGYENHFAAFANLVVPIALCLGIRARRAAHRRGRLSSPSVLLFFSCALLVVAVIFSRSRAGMVVCALMLAAVFVQQCFFRPRYSSFPMVARGSWSRYERMGAGVAVVILAAGLAVVSTRIDYDQLGVELSFRAQVLRDTWKMGGDRPFWGTGPGTFAAIFPYYQSMPTEDFFFLHAHCDPIEFLAEWGIVGSALMSGFWLLLFLSFRRNDVALRDEPPLARVETIGLALGVVGVVFHSLVDFPLHHPLIALLALICVATLFNDCCSRSLSQGEPNA